MSLHMGPNSLWGIGARLADAGFAVLRLRTAASAAALAQRLGSVLDVTEVRLGNGRTYLCSADSIPPHTDHPAARLILWYCHQADDSGAGANLLVDTRSVIEALPAPIAMEMASVELSCPGVQTLAPTGTHPLYRPKGKQVFYAPWLCMEPRSEALLAFEAELGKPEHRRQILLHEGEALLVDNRRMLHLRDALPAHSLRWLTRYWIGDGLRFPRQTGHPFHAKLDSLTRPEWDGGKGITVAPFRHFSGGLLDQ